MKLQKWEHKISFPSTFESSIEHMDKQGQKGWECCGVRFNKDADIVDIVWKRPIK